MQAIQTKYLGPSNSHGSRIKATCQAKSITRARDYHLNGEDDHRRVARELAQEMGWHGHWVQGCLPSGDYAFVSSKRLDGPTEGFDVWKEAL